MQLYWAKVVPICSWLKPFAKALLDEHPTLHALVSMVIAKAKTVNMGHTSRFTASKCKGVDAGALEELAFTLTLCTGRNSLLWLEPSHFGLLPHGRANSALFFGAISC